MKAKITIISGVRMVGVPSLELLNHPVDKLASFFTAGAKTKLTPVLRKAGLGQPVENAPKHYSNFTVPMFEGTIVLEGNQIREVTHDPPAALFLNNDNVEMIQAPPGSILSAGLIDQQLNGAYGVDYNHCTVAELMTSLKQLPMEGITTILPTVITAPMTDMITAINTIEQAIHLGFGQDRLLNRSVIDDSILTADPFNPTDRCCRIGGIHLEGPFLSPDFPGIHPKANIQSPTVEDLALLISPNLKLMTLAPEVTNGMELVRYLTGRDIRVACGHSSASPHLLKQAVELGLTGITHLFNAMRPMHHRDPGMIPYALLEQTLYPALIADGHHVHPDVIKMAINTMGVSRCIVASDAMSLAGTPTGAEQRFANQVIYNRNGRAENAAGALAGSATLLTEGIRNLVRWGVLPFEQAILTATLIPALFLGLKDRGCLAPGKLADLVLWNPNTLAIEATWVDGQLVYQPSQQLQVA